MCKSINTAPNVFTPEYLEKLNALNNFCRKRIAEGYRIISARLLPNDQKATLVLDRNFRGSCADWIDLKQKI